MGIACRVMPLSLLEDEQLMKCRWVKQAIHAELDALTEGRATAGDGLPVEFEVDSVLHSLPGIVPPAACPYTEQCTNAICTHGYSQTSNYSHFFVCRHLLHLHLMGDFYCQCLLPTHPASLNCFIVGVRRIAKWRVSWRARV